MEFSHFGNPGNSGCCAVLWGNRAKNHATISAERNSVGTAAIPIPLVSTYADVQTTHWTRPVSAWNLRRRQRHHIHHPTLLLLVAANSCYRLRPFTPGRTLDSLQYPAAQPLDGLESNRIGCGARLSHRQRHFAPGHVMGVSDCVFAHVERVQTADGETDLARFRGLKLYLADCLVSALTLG